MKGAENVTDTAEMDLETAKNTAFSRPWRNAFYYFGGKGKIADWIIPHFPPHELYAEPFGGAANVLLRKRPSRYEVYNDLNGEVVNVFRVLRAPERRVELSRVMALTPVARDENEYAFSGPPTDDPVERARRFLVRAEMSIGHNPTSARNPGFDVRHETTGSAKCAPLPSRWRETVENLPAVAARMAEVVLENRPALEILNVYDRPGALFYCDPPYVADTRRSGVYHGLEMSDEDHAALAEALNRLKGHAVISGYRCALYDELYKGWRRIDKKSIANTCGERSESIWLSPGIKPPPSLF